MSYIEDLMTEAHRVLRPKGAVVVVVRTHIKPTSRHLLAQESTTIMHMRDGVYSVTVYRKEGTAGHKGGGTRRV
jgi:ubiquinone/menaquinone biosynthesis C-methylase UbiE